jgi:SAM-dependent methyltransferase
MKGEDPVQAHYQNLLAPVYSWMVGDLWAALARSRELLAAVGLGAGSGLAVDLGAGFGLHAIPLAEAGFHVVALDSSATLLEELGRLEHLAASGPAIQSVLGDLRAFRALVPGPCAAVVCLGDTLTHLGSPAEVEAVIRDAAVTLVPGGRLVLGFRDHSGPPREGTARFIPVRSDDERILTCFLEYGPAHVDVHDLLHERQGEAWSLKVSAYRKLRLEPRWVAERMSAAGLRVEAVAAPPGVATLVGVK